nr:MAG TPA: helix-turn-helix domain protein [Caudoviricetes sp.]
MRANIEAERGRLQLSKEDMSKELGITSKTYLSYVRGTTPIPSDVLIKMAKRFGCTTDYLLGLQTNNAS